MGKEGLPWEPNGKLVISVSSNGIWNLTNPEVSSGLPHMKSMNWFLGCFPPFFSLVYAGAEFPVEGAAFDF